MNKHLWLFVMVIAFAVFAWQDDGQPHNQKSKAEAHPSKIKITTSNI